MSPYPYDPAPGQTDTSASAADAIAPSAATLQQLALDAITTAGVRGLTAEELAYVVDVDRVAIQPRTTELRKQGLIKDSGQRRPNASGKNAIAWVAT